jgi:hypothetical protein
MGENSFEREALAVRRMSPAFSIEQAKAVTAYKRDADMNLLLDGRRKPGLRQ